MLITCAFALSGCGRATDQGGAGPIASEVSAVSTPDQRPSLAPRAKELIAAAEQARRGTVVLTIAAAEGRTEATALALRDLGATVESVDSTVGYIRATVPVSAAARAATLDGVSRADVEEPIGFPDPTP